MSDSLPFGRLIYGIKRLFPPALLSGNGLDRLLAVAEGLPLCVVDRPFGFEFALGSEAAAADFCVTASPDSALAAHFIRAGETASSDSAAVALGTFLSRNARDPTSFLARRDGSIILEYDVPARAGVGPPPPGIFFVPGDDSVDAARRLLSDPTEAISALWAAAGLRADAAELHRVKRVWEVLSVFGLVVQAGALPGRPQRAVRLVIHRIETAMLSGLLNRLGWPGSVDTVVSALEATNEFTSPGAVLSLDVSGNGISPRLGLELFRPVQRYSIDRTGWRPLLDRLAEKQWCTPAKAQGLRAWPRTGQMLGPRGVYRVHQYINHIKIVVEHGLIAAKAYAAMVVGGVHG